MNFEKSQWRCRNGEFCLMNYFIVFCYGKQVRLVRIVITSGLKSPNRLSSPANAGDLGQSIWQNLFKIDI